MQKLKSSKDIMYTIIITGNLGTGKSSFANILRKKAYPVLSADNIINNIYKEGLFKQEMSDIFSLKLSQVSKQAVSKLAFQDLGLLKKLENLLYPELTKRLNVYKKNYKTKQTLYLFYEAPVFFEKNQSKNYDYVVVLSADKELCISRCLQKNISKDQFNKINRTQMPIKDKEHLADYVIFNNTTLKDLQKEAGLFLKTLKNKYE